MRGLILTVVAIVLSITTMWLGLTYTLFSLVLNGRWKDLNAYFFDIAVSIDQLGNVVMRDLFNRLLITKQSPYLFGNEDEVISSVLGKNQQLGTLKFLGKLVVGLLDVIDPNHSINSIEYRQLFTKKNKDNQN